MAGSMPQKRDIRLTQKKILDAAHAEFSSVGFDASRIESIALRAGVSRQLVYHYFGSLEELYSEVLDLESEKFMEPLNQIDFDCPDPLDALRAFVGVLFDIHRDSAGFITMDAGLHGGTAIRPSGKIHKVTEKFLGRVRHAIERGQQMGLLAEDADAEVFYGMTIVVVSGSVTSGGLLTKILKRDCQSENAVLDWRARVMDMMVKSIAKPR